LFWVAQGGGSAVGIVQATNLQGVATVGDWQFTRTGPNTLVAKTPLGYLSPNEVNFTVNVVDQAKSGTAVSLDGIDDHVTVPSSLLFDVSSITIEAWIRLDRDVGPQQARIANRQSTQGGAESWGLEIFGAGYGGTGSTGNDVVFHSGNCSVDKNLQTGFNLQINRWYHLAAVNNGSTMSVYVDGQLVKSTATVGPLCKPSNVPIVIGRTGPGSQFFFPGAIDEVRIWGVARSGQQIQQNMRSTLSGGENGLIGYWRFDEGTGLTAFDATPNGNHATLRNGGTWTAQTW
jgi:hypothetical protein